MVGVEEAMVATEVGAEALELHDCPPVCPSPLEDVGVPPHC
jgi:hypothetical protein